MKGTSLTRKQLCKPSPLQGPWGTFPVCGYLRSHTRLDPYQTIQIRKQMWHLQFSEQPWIEHICFKILESYGSLLPVHSSIRHPDMGAQYPQAVDVRGLLAQINNQFGQLDQWFDRRESQLNRMELVCARGMGNTVVFGPQVWGVGVGCWKSIPLA